ncbi:MAG TPA: hypothetical protein VGO59_09370 [Verrucomicrobiae bacterium]|jgi:hypothetical protein
MTKRRRQRESLSDILIVWGFLLSFIALLGAGCFEAWKVVSVIPAAFQSSTAVMRNPMWASSDDSGPSRGSSAKERYRQAQRAAEEGR